MSYDNVLKVAFAYWQEVERAKKNLPRFEWEFSSVWNHNRLTKESQRNDYIHRQFFSWNFFDRIRFYIKCLNTNFHLEERGYLYTKNEIYRLISLFSNDEDDFNDVFFVGPENPRNEIITCMKNSFLVFFTNVPFYKHYSEDEINFCMEEITRRKQNPSEDEFKNPIYIGKLQETARSLAILCSDSEIGFHDKNKARKDATLVEKKLQHNFEMVFLVFKKIEYELSAQEIRYSHETKLFTKKCVVNSDFIFDAYRLHFIAMFIIQFRKYNNIESHYKQ